MRSSQVQVRLITNCYLSLRTKVDTLTTSASPNKKKILFQRRDESQFIIECFYMASYVICQNKTLICCK